MRELTRRMRLQKELAACAKVRNATPPYSCRPTFGKASTICAAHPTRRSSMSGGGPSGAAATPKPLPADYCMDVHCISANDYLKLSNIKDRSTARRAASGWPLTQASRACAPTCTQRRRGGARRRRTPSCAPPPISSNCSSCLWPTTARCRPTRAAHPGGVRPRHPGLRAGSGRPD